MKYMLTLFMRSGTGATTSPEERAAAMAAWDDYTAELRDAGAFIAGEGLAPSATATTIRLGARSRSPPTGRSRRRRSSSAAST